MVLPDGGQAESSRAKCGKIAFLTGVVCLVTMLRLPWAPSWGIVAKYIVQSFAVCTVCFVAKALFFESIFFMKIMAMLLSGKLLSLVLYFCVSAAWTIFSALSAIIGWRALTAILVYSSCAFLFYCYTKLQEEAQRISAELGAETFGRHSGNNDLHVADPQNNQLLRGDQISYLVDGVRIDQDAESTNNNTTLAMGGASLLGSGSIGNFDQIPLDVPSPDMSQRAEVDPSWASVCLSWIWNLFSAWGVAVLFAVAFIAAPAIPLVAMAVVLVRGRSPGGVHGSWLLSKHSSFGKLCKMVVVASVTCLEYLLSTIRRSGGSLLRRGRKLTLYFLFVLLTSVLGYKRNATAYILLSLAG